MIREVLFVGKENAQSARDLCGLLGISTRTLSQIVERERRRGAPICASTDAAAPGYFLARDKAEMAIYCKSLDHRAREIRKTRRACMKSLDDLPEREAK